MQGVPNYFSLSGRPGTACDFAFAVLMDLPIQGRVRPRRFVFSCGQHYQASSGIAAVDAADPCRLHSLSAPSPERKTPDKDAALFKQLGSSASAAADERASERRANNGTLQPE